MSIRKIFRNYNITTTLTCDYCFRKWEADWRNMTTCPWCGKRRIGL